jgi:hypothetical protein
MVDVVEAGRYMIMAKSNTAKPRVYEGKKMDDAIYYGDEQCYHYYVKSASSDVTIKFQLFSGLVSSLIEPWDVAWRIADGSANRTFRSQSNSTSNSVFMNISSMMRNHFWN